MKKSKKFRSWKTKESPFFMKKVDRKAQFVSKSDQNKAVAILKKLAKKTKSGAVRLIQRAFRGFKGRTKAWYQVPHAKYWKKS